MVFTLHRHELPNNGFFNQITKGIVPNTPEHKLYDSKSATMMQQSHATGKLFILNLINEKRLKSTLRVHLTQHYHHYFKRTREAKATKTMGKQKCVYIANKSLLLVTFITSRPKRTAIYVIVYILIWPLTLLLPPIHIN